MNDSTAAEQPRRASTPPQARRRAGLVYEERLTTPRMWWAIAIMFGVAMSLVFLPLGPLPGLLGLAGGAVLACLWVNAQGSVRIRITADVLAVGDARIPLTALGPGEVLSGREAFAWRTHRADLRAFTVERSHIPTAVRIENTDPADPTPYVYLSTRDPKRLLGALAEARS